MNENLFRGWGVGIDIGGTKIEGILIDEHSVIHSRTRIKTNAYLKYESIVKRIISVIQEVQSNFKGTVSRFGIAIPGNLDPETGLIENCNIDALNGKDLCVDLKMALGIEVKIANDANCFAIAEALLGAGRDFDPVFGLVIGTGCGGGLVVRQTLVTGANCAAGELGHMTLRPGGLSCYCGAQGCVERYVSGSAISDSYERHTGVKLRSEEIVAAYLSGTDMDANNAMEIFFESFGQAISNVIKLFDPEIIIVGGGLSNIESIYDNGKNYISKYSLSSIKEINIVKHSLGDAAGAIGATLFV